jgi:hypothetical protein
MCFEFLYHRPLGTTGSLPPRICKLPILPGRGQVCPPAAIPLRRGVLAGRSVPQGPCAFGGAWAHLEVGTDKICSLSANDTWSFLERGPGADICITLLLCTTFMVSPGCGRKAGVKSSPRTGQVCFTRGTQLIPGIPTAAPYTPITEGPPVLWPSSCSSPQSQVGLKEEGEREVRGLGRGGG